MRILFLFLDGVGLGDDDPDTNPFAAADLPTLTGFTKGRPWLRGLPRIESERGTFLPTDACLGVDGSPQSATGQAAILTGINVPERIGYHYGPKPNPPIAEIVRQESVVKKLVGRGLRAGLLNAYPPRWFETVERGKRLLSSNQLAMQAAGVKFLGMESLFARQAMSTDFTGRGWRTELGYSDAPILEPFEAGQLLARLACEHDFTFFDHWVTDYLGHRGTREQAVELLGVLDGVLAGLLAEWDDSGGLIVLTSDHGNFENLSRRGHTRNPVPTLVIGEARRTFLNGLTDLTGFATGILRVLNGSQI